MRTLVSTTLLNDYKQWPGLEQLYRLTRERTVAGETSTEVEYGIASLSRDQADARDLLAQRRGHWGIENRLHHVRDVTMGEDGCRVRSGASPQILAGIRNAALSLLRTVNPKNVAAAMRTLTAKPFKAIRLIHNNR